MYIMYICLLYLFVLYLLVLLFTLYFFHLLSVLLYTCSSVCLVPKIESVVQETVRDFYLHVWLAPEFFSNVGCWDRSKVVFPSSSQQISSEFPFSDIPGTVISAPLFESISASFNSFVTSFSFSARLGGSISRVVTFRLSAGLGFISSSLSSFSFFFSLQRSLSFALLLSFSSVI